MKQPNLCFVFADQWRRQAVGYRGEDPVSTPTMDRFAETALVLENALSCCPLCSPHRAALFTGRYPYQNGVLSNCRPGIRMALNTHDVCFTDVLAQSGYHTGYIGKWHLDEPDCNSGADAVSGATSWDGFTPPGPRRHGVDFWYAYNCHNSHMRPHYWHDTPEKIAVDQWSPEHETDMALHFLDTRDPEQPFALFMSWNPPHTPYESIPEAYRQRYAGRPMPLRPNQPKEHLTAILDRYRYSHESTMQNLDAYCFEDVMRDYFAAVTGLDEQFGRLLDALEQRGLRKDTIVVLTADHGEMLGSHGHLYKGLWYEESVGIPFLISWPGHIRVGTENALHNSVDTMPTLLGLMGLPVPPTVAGTDMSARFRGEAQPVPETALLALYRDNPSASRAAALRKAGITWQQTGWRAVRSARYTFVMDRGDTGAAPCRMLVDNQEDPYQLAPLVLSGSESNPEAETLYRAMVRHLDAIGDPFLMGLE